MDKRYAAKVADQLMRKHGLVQDGWVLRWDKSSGRFGVCRHWSKVIGLSLPLTELNSNEQVIETILHEIAHALAGPEAGHGPAWKRKCLEIGAKPERCYGIDVKRPGAKWVVVCETPGCKNEGKAIGQWVQRPKYKTYSCRGCRKGPFGVRLSDEAIEAIVFTEKIAARTGKSIPAAVTKGQKIADYMRDHPGASAKEVAAAIGCHINRVYEIKRGRR